MIPMNDKPVEKPRTYLPHSEALRIARKHATRELVPVVASFLTHCYDDQADVERTLRGLRNNTHFLSETPTRCQRVRR
jgi:hypothetical protein